MRISYYRSSEKHAYKKTITLKKIKIVLWRSRGKMFINNHYNLLKKMTNFTDFQKILGNPFNGTDAKLALEGYHFVFAETKDEPQLVDLKNEVNGEKLKKILEADSELFDNPDEKHYTCIGSGLEIITTNNVISTIFFYGPGISGWVPYLGTLLPGISFESCLNDIEKLMGEPTVKGKEQKNLLGNFGTWCRYDQKDGQSIHFSFHHQIGSLSMVTIMSEIPDHLRVDPNDKSD